MSSCRAVANYQQIINFFKRLQYALETQDISFMLKVKQIVCPHDVFCNHDVIAIFPTGFGKSIIYQLLPNLIPTKKEKNIVVVVSPLNSIIEDQLSSLKKRNVTAAVLQTEDQNNLLESLFIKDNHKGKRDPVPQKIKDGDASIVFSHPESLLNSGGRKLMLFSQYQDNVVAYVIDEAHCIAMW